MARWWDKQWSGSLSLVALASALGCDAQVNDEYTGEPLLTLKGTVVMTEEQANSNLVPCLAFYAGEWLVFVDGEVSGEFPAKFRFDVTQPPPTQAMWQPDSGGLSLALGFLVMLPPDHPDRVPTVLNREYLNEDCNEDFTHCTNTVRECDNANRCRERVEECIERPCEQVEHLGDTPLDESTSQDFGHLSCNGETCDSAQTSCDAAGNCTIDIQHCDPGEDAPNATASTGGTMTICTVLSETGDAFVSRDDLETAAVGFGIAYVASDDPEYQLARGYHLYTAPPRTEWVEQLKCQTYAQAEAVAQYNQEHGTSYSGLSTDDEVAHLQLAAENECRQVAESTSERTEPSHDNLTIELGPPPSF